MSGDEGFLARWSRRKSGATAPPRDPVKPDDAPGAAASPASAATPPADPAPIDPASLPPIESIGAGSDIRAFLAAGVPADLTRAALRRIWSADPAIRDFIGLSENSWDFNAPGGVPGFGPINADEVRRLLTQVTGEPEADEKASVAATVVADPGVSDSASAQPKPDQFAGAGPGDPAPGDKTDTAAQHELGESEGRPPLPRRGHGGALPQ